MVSAKVLGSLDEATNVPSAAGYCNSFATGEKLIWHAARAGETSEPVGAGAIGGAQAADHQAADHQAADQG